ncbi:ATP-dependent DNA helicase pcrA, partial [Sporormia fimetaria CBS 119925]
MDAILAGLNEAQRAAVTSQANVIQVLAPPGSGKTKTLTARVAYLISQGLRPWNIVVCTFTIKAAREMKERISGMVGDGIEQKLILGTFHSVARRFLVRYGQEIGIEKSFGVADTTDSLAIIKRIIKRHDYNVEPKKARSTISALKSKGTSADEYAALQKKALEHEMMCVYSEYEETLKASKLLDYDDLLLRCVDLLRRNLACASSIEAVLIDEYQDTNNVQYELMKLLAQKLKRITIVGDPDQSIYSFRSAEIKNLYRMRDEYPESLVINLENNYRSSGCILSAAKAVIEQDDSRPSKPLQATHCVGEQPTLRHLADARKEAEWIVEEIQRSRTLSAGLLNFGDYAILLRSSPLSLSIERELGYKGIPYRMVGGRRFFDRAEIRLVLDYLRVINQPNHNDAILRVINEPSRQVGEATVKALVEQAEAEKVPLWSVLLSLARGCGRSATKVSKQAQGGIDKFVGIILSSQRKLTKDDECNLYDLMTHLLQKVSMHAYLKKQYPEGWEERWANVEELIGQATQLAASIANGEAVYDDMLPEVDGLEQRPDTAADILSKFLSNVALASEIEGPEGEDPNQVTISTIHAAKGLEWPIVFIPGVYDGSIPHSRADDHDEERRLLYVGMTRAQSLLYLSCPAKLSGQDESTLSAFISKPSIQRFFSLRGPSFGCTAISDLARILSRPCPSLSEVEAARSLLERIEDDKFPLHREYVDPEDGLDDARSFKRYKPDPSYSSAKFTVTTTIEKTSNFSVARTTIPHGGGGFTTARAHQMVIQETRTREAAESAPVSFTMRKQVNPIKDLDPSRSKPIKPRAKGQGSITSFF